jgi:hypothetical protein
MTADRPAAEREFLADLCSGAMRKLPPSLSLRHRTLLPLSRRRAQARIWGSPVVRSNEEMTQIRPLLRQAPEAARAPLERVLSAVTAEVDGVAATGLAEQEDDLRTDSRRMPPLIQPLVVAQSAGRVSPSSN